MRPPQYVFDRVGSFLSDGNFIKKAAGRQFKNHDKELPNIAILKSMIIFDSIKAVLYYSPIIKKAVILKSFFRLPRLLSLEGKWDLSNINEFGLKCCFPGRIQ